MTLFDASGQQLGAFSGPKVPSRDLLRIPHKGGLMTFIITRPCSTRSEIHALLSDRGWRKLHGAEGEPNPQALNLIAALPVGLVVALIVTFLATLEATRMILW